MAKRILLNGNSASINLSSKISTHTNENLKTISRKKRSKTYMDTLKELKAFDKDTAQVIKEKIDKIKLVLQDELPDINIDDLLLGIVSKCYLGEPYEVHSLNLSGGIVEHYKKGETMPNGLEKARNLAQNKAYEFIEVYKNSLHAIDSSGNVSVIKI